tara:strand:- start:795 stop:1079 length:285 start_codon:yes stop_codon:yes gene_type:complete
LNFESINNVSDLVEANNETDPTEAIHALIGEAVSSHGPKVALDIAAEIIGRLVNLHDAVAEDKVAEGDAETAMLWAQDSRTLTMAKFMVESIEM